MPTPFKVHRPLILPILGFPFFAFGLVFLYLTGSYLFEAWQVTDWHETEGKVQYAQLIEVPDSRARSSRDASFQLQAGYSYVVGDQIFQGHRVFIDDSAQKESYFARHGWLNELVEAQDRKKTIRVWVDPNNPANALLYRDMQWSQIALKCLMLFVLGGIGVWLTFFAGRRSDPGSHRRQTGGFFPLLDQGGKNLALSWGFAAVWVLVATPPLVDAIESQIVSRAGLAASIFLSAIGLGLVLRAILKTFEWFRFGRTPLTLNPRTAQIGGSLVGAVRIARCNLPQTDYRLTLVCNCKRRGASIWNIVWHAQCIAGAQPIEGGLRVSFEFKLPNTIPNPYNDGRCLYLWQLRISAEFPDVNLNRQFDISDRSQGDGDGLSIRVLP